MGDLKTAKKNHSESNYVTALKYYQITIDKIVVAPKYKILFTKVQKKVIGKDRLQDAKDGIDKLLTSQALTVNELCAMAQLYVDTPEVKSNYAQAIVWYQKAQVKGGAVAYREEGMLYTRGGRGIEVNLVAAAKGYQKAIDYGYVQAENDLISLLYSDKISAADSHSIAKMYHEGEEINQDFINALFWYEKTSYSDNTIDSNYFKNLLEDPRMTSVILMKIADLYYSGNVVRRNHAKALECYEKIILRSKQPELDRAQQHKGHIYKAGFDGVRRDFVIAAQCYQQGLERESKDADSNLMDLFNTPMRESDAYAIAELYYHNNRIAHHHQDALKWYEKAKLLGSILAPKNIGSFYENGLGVEKNLVRAVQYYQQAVDRGHLPANSDIQRIINNPQIPVTILIEIAALYHRGTTININNNKALEYCDKAIALQANFSSAYHYKGLIYENISNHVMAAQCYQQAYDIDKNKISEAGIARLFNNPNMTSDDANFIATMYFKGEYTKRNDETVLKWFKKARDQGSAVAYRNSGVLSEKGYGVPKNLATAAQYYQQAIDRGCSGATKDLKSILENVNLQADVLLQIAILYHAGTEVKRDPIKALSLYEKIIQKFPQAISTLVAYKHKALIYQQGDGIQADLNIAVQCYQQALDNGDENKKTVESLSSLLKNPEISSYNACLIALKYQYGSVVKRNVEKALLWYQKARQQGATIQYSDLDWFNENEIHQIKKIEAIFSNQGLNQSLKTVADKELVIFIGPTGAGKSTLINYLFGSRYDLNSEDKTVVFQKKSISEKVDVGKNVMQSETLYPSVFPIAEQSFALCDFSGFGETRGAEAAIIGTVAAHMLIRASKSIKRIVFTIDINFIKQSRGLGLREAFLMLKTILGNIDSNDLKNVTLAITKIVVKPEVDLHNINSLFIEKYILAARDDLLERENRTKGEEVILQVCEYFIKNPHQVIVVDACDNGRTVDYFVKTQLVPNTSVPGTSINLLQGVKETIQLAEFLESKLTLYKNVINIISNHPQREAKRNAEIEKINQELKSENESLNMRYKQHQDSCDNNLNAEKYLQMLVKPGVIGTFESYRKNQLFREKLSFTKIVAQIDVDQESFMQKAAEGLKKQKNKLQESYNDTDNGRILELALIMANSFFNSVYQTATLLKLEMNSLIIKDLIQLYKQSNEKLRPYSIGLSSKWNLLSLFKPSFAREANLFIQQTIPSRSSTQMSYFRQR